MALTIYTLCTVRATNRTLTTALGKAPALTTYACLAIPTIRVFKTTVTNHYTLAAHALLTVTAGILVIGAVAALTALTAGAIAVVFTVAIVYPSPVHAFITVACISARTRL